MTLAAAQQVHRPLHPDNVDNTAAIMFQGTLSCLAARIRPFRPIVESSTC